MERALHSPKLTYALIVLIFGIGGWVTKQEVEVGSISRKLQKHESIPFQIQKLEITQGYIRKDVQDIKEIVKQNQKDMRNFISEQRARN